MKLDGAGEVDFTMQLPMIFLAILCVLFGIFARYPLERFIIPIISGQDVSVDSLRIATAQGFGSPVLATGLMIIGLVVGLIIYAIGKLGKTRVDENVWIGGNVMDNEEIRIPGTHFYKTITDELNPAASAGFRDGESGALDVYNFFARLGNGLVQVLRNLHNGVLSTYLAWSVIGLGVLAFVLMFIKEFIG